MSKTKSKATPGPWRVQYTPPKVPNPASYRIMGDDKDGVPHTIAHVFSKTNEANAALIAASPMLLIAAKRALTSLEAAQLTVSAKDLELIQRGIAELMNAIAAAEGRERE